MNARIVASLAACALAAASGGAAPVPESSAQYQALLHAIIQNDVSAAKKLLDQGLDPNVRVRPAPEDAWVGDHGQPADQPLLAVAARFGVPESPFVAMLLERRAAPDIRDAKQRTPLMYAARLGWGPSVDLLLRRQVDVNAADEDGVTVLMHAMGNRNLTTVATLVAKGSRVNAKDRRGQTPLMHAIRRARRDPIRIYGTRNDPVQETARYVELVRFLIDRGADVNARDDSGDTPLRLAARQDAPELVEALKRAGARD
jgi:ankyrin repeat protein